MIAYPDTSFLYALYLDQNNSSRAISHANRMAELPHLTSLLLFEFRQSIRRQAFLHAKDLLKGFDLSIGSVILAKMQANIAAGAVVVVPAEWNDVHQIAERLSSRHTRAEGHRAFDILHIATALHLGAREFLTFDANQKKLAKAEGLKVPL